MGLVDKIKELPQSKTATMDEITGGGEGEHDNALTDKVVREEKKPAAKTEEVHEEDKEPEKDAPPAEVDAYRQRKVKKADKEKDDAKREAEEAKRDLARERERADRLERIALERAQPEKKPAEASKPAPTLETDPRGFVENVAKNTEDVQKELVALKTERIYRQAEEELADHEKGFAQKTPDYSDALKWAEDREVANEKAMNPNANEALVRRNFKAQKLQAAARAAANGRNPAEVLYQLTVNAGYQKKQSTEEEHKPDPAKNFDAVKKNKEKSTGLSAGGRSGASDSAGPENAKGLTLKDFAKLSKDKKDSIYK